MFCRVGLILPRPAARRFAQAIERKHIPIWHGGCK
jgi:hypothetical protein